MNIDRENIIRMAREAGLLPILNEDAFQKWEWEKTNKVLERFAVLVAAASAAKEREACAKVCEELIQQRLGKHLSFDMIAAAIRSRGNT